MNLELPFAEMPPSELDALLADIDRELDALFLDEVDAHLEAQGAERTPEAAASAA